MSVICNVGDEIAERYSIEAFINEGGMQQVYKAYDQILNRTVALKVPKNTAASRRFRRSAALSAKLNHPNVAKTLDYVESDGQFYLIEEFLDGADLKHLLDQIERFDPAASAHILHHLAKGVASSHHVGVVHRDLKPSNVMVEGEFTFRSIKVTDFGIAKMAAQELEEAIEGGNDTITTSHTVMGALPYLSPEMVESPRKADSPTDVWALAAMAFEMLTGLKPFGSGLNAVPRIVSGTLPKLPSSVVTNPQFKSLAESLWGIIQSCLVRDPARRPTADILVEQCAGLCYSHINREFGTVQDLKYSGAFGFISADTDGDVFFHSESVCGKRLSVGDRVWFERFAGEPYPRAHPVVALRTVGA